MVTVTSINPQNFVIGPAKIRYRDVGVLTAYTDVGVTLDDAVMRLSQELWSPDNLNGVFGKVKGLDNAQMVNAEIEFTLGELAGAKMALAIPGATYTAPVLAVSSGGGSSTTTAATLAGATVVPFTAVTSFTAGDYFSIDTGSVKEYRRIVLISSLNVTVDYPLLFDHASGVAVVETDGDNRSVVTMPTHRRMVDADYKEWSLVAESGKSGPNELVIPIGIASGTGDMTVDDQAVSGLRVTIQGRLDPANLETSMFRLYSPA
jgi:hypothetical protein